MSWGQLLLGFWTCSLSLTGLKTYPKLHMPWRIRQQLYIDFVEGSKAVFMQSFLSWVLSQASSGICSCNVMQAFITCSGCHPAYFHPPRQAAKFNSDLPQWCVRAATAEICLLIPLSEHTDHKLLVRLTTANSVIISSQETSGKSAVGNAALSVSCAEFSLQIAVLYPSTRLPINISFRAACGLHT